MNLGNFLGWKTSRKIIVFESDDWGSFRFQNKAIRDAYLPNYDPNGWMHYNDCFESIEDLTALESTLKSVKDKNNKYACFTFLMNPANPDFKKIKQSDFQQFYNETFLETLSKREDGQDIFRWYKASLKTQLIEIGFHGREHLNVKSWMKDLQTQDKNTLKGFQDNIWGHNIILSNKEKKRHRSTFNLTSYQDIEDLKKNINQGVQLLNETFNQQTTYFLPPDGPYHIDLNKSLVDNGIKYIGLSKKHKNPLENKWYQTKLFWLGKRTKEGLRVVTRNVIFEPSSPRQKDWVKHALEHINSAFENKKPAVISSHRANYSGSLNEKNRSNSNQQLKSLLEKIKNKWPDVEFMTSSQLGELTIKDTNSILNK